MLRATDANAGHVGQAESALSLEALAQTSTTALRFPRPVSFDSWQRLGRQISLISNASAWWLADWLAYGQSQYGRRYRQALVLTGLDYQTLRNYVWVAVRVPPSRRRDTLTFQHHAEVASLPGNDQERWLAEAEEGRWSRNELRRRLRVHRRGAVASDGGPVVLRISVDAERERRWKAAAELDDHALDDWLAGVADQAAEHVLGITVGPRPEAALGP